MEKLSPMLKQYMDIKNEYPDALVLFRLGDFYELFFEDAKIASYELDLVLTARAAGDQQKAPMCGVPHHAVSSYIQKLVENGHKVAIVEQMEDPSVAVGIVKRDVVKVVTQGTMTDEWLDDKNKNIIASLTKFAGAYTVVLSELISGLTECEVFKAQPNLLKEFVLRQQVREIIITSSLDKESLYALREIPHLMISYQEDVQIPDAYLMNIKGIIDPIKQQTYGRLINTLLQSQKRSLMHLQVVQDEKSKTRMALDYSTLINLELIEPIRAQSKHATLFSFMDQCKSSMGSRLLKEWITQPLKQLSDLELRQAQVTALLNESLDRLSLRDHLTHIYDLERLVGKVSIHSAGPQDVLRLQKTLNQVPSILRLLKDDSFDSLKTLDECHALSQILNEALNEEVPAFIKDGNVFKTGYHLELDELREIQHHGQKWLIQFEQEEKERTQIKNLKIGYNRVFGYFIEVSKGSMNLIQPEFNYVRKQTLSTGERYITASLKDMEDKILHAQEKALRLESALFNELLERITIDLQKLQTIANSLATIDVIQAMATLAYEHHYVKPTFHTDFELEIIEGRHPILETRLDYISNSTHMSQESYIHLLTGPNMGGKSTYMRQVALILVMAHMGSYVPAKKASIPLLDAIFTRMGASDDILEGHSTFMLEMTEANTALTHASAQSIVFFDEIGRGTSTYDGMALAQSMVEYLATVNRCKTIFSTHYHELTHLENSLPQVKNVHVEVHEQDQEVTFLYRVKHGKADRSYGVNVARLAHLPSYITDRAHHLLIDLESKKRVVQQSMEVVEIKHTPHELETILSDLKHINIDQTTPLEALKYLDTWKKGLKD